MHHAVDAARAAPGDWLRERVPAPEHGIAQRVEQVTETVAIEYPLTEDLLEIAEAQRKLLVAEREQTLGCLATHELLPLHVHRFGVVLVQRVAHVHEAAFGVNCHRPFEHQVLGGHSLVQECENAAVKRRIEQRIAFLRAQAVRRFPGFCIGASARARLYAR